MGVCLVYQGVDARDEISHLFQELVTMDAVKSVLVVYFENYFACSVLRVNKFPCRVDCDFAAIWNSHTQLIWFEKGPAEILKLTHTKFTSQSPECQADSDGSHSATFLG